MQSVDGIVKACTETKLITDKAFKGIEGIKPPALPNEDDEEIPQIQFK